MHYSPLGWPYSVQAVFAPESVSDSASQRRIARVTPAEFPFFAEVWRALTTAWPGYTLASRRFYQAGIRENAVDSLLDDMIAAEAVLLPNMRDELKYRLAIHAAQYLAGDDRAERRRVFDFYKQAYDLRSAVAHGSDPAQLNPRLHGVNVSPWQFEAAFRDSLQRLLRLMVERGDCARPIAWTDRLIGPQ
jgi:hypothetical protein